MKISFFFIVFLITFQEISLREILKINNIKNTESGIDLDFEIVNSSKLDYYYNFNESQIFFIDNLNDEESVGINIEITNFKNDNIVNFISYPFLNPKETKKLLKNEKKIKSFKFIIEAGNKRDLQIITSKYYIMQHLKNQFQYNKLKDISDSLFIRIAYKQDSIKIKSLLLPQTYDSLQKNNIKIFHGTIYSNKIPLNNL